MKQGPVNGGLISADGLGNCPYCGGKSRAHFVACDWNQKSTLEHFQYRRCRACGLIFITPLPSDIQKYYRYEQYDIPTSASGFDQRATTQAWKLDLLRPFVSRGNLLEIGPATGEFATVARVAGFDVKLIEMSRECCTFLRDILKHDVIQSSDPAGHLDTDERFDAVCIWQAIEHISNFWELIGEAAKCLRPGGVIAISTPNPRSIQARLLGSRWPHVDAPRHLYLIPISWFETACVGWGLRTVAATTCDVGSLGLNYYGWYLWVRNLIGRYVLADRVNTLAARLTTFFSRWETVEGRGCSYVLIMVKDAD